MYWAGQNHLYTLYMAVYWVISLPKIPFIYRIYLFMVLVNPTRVVHIVHHIPYVRIVHHTIPYHIIKYLTIYIP